MGETRDIDTSDAKVNRPDAVLRRHRLWVRAGVALAVIIVVMLDRAGLLLAATDDAPRLDGAEVRFVSSEGAGRVRLAMDNDSDPREFEFRLLGVAAYVHPQERDEFAPLAADFIAEALAQGSVLRVQPGAPRARWRAPAGRIETPAGEDVAVLLVRRGLVRADEHALHDHRRAIQKASLAARRSGAGLWSHGEAPVGETR